MDIKTYQVNKTYTDKEVKKVDDRVTTITTEQQQDGEVIEARDGEVSLKAKMDSVDAQLADYATQINNLDAEKADQINLDTTNANLANGLALKRNIADKITTNDIDKSVDVNKIHLLDLAEEVQQAMAGTAPVIGSVADGSLTTTKYADDSITDLKLNSSISKYRLLRSSWFKDFITFASLGASGISLTLGGILHLQYTKFGILNFDFATTTNIVGGTLANGRITFTIPRTSALVLDLSVTVPVIKVVSYSAITANVVCLCFCYDSQNVNPLPVSGLLLDILNTMKKYQSFDTSYRGYGFSSNNDCNVEIEQSKSSGAGLTITVQNGFVILSAKDYANAIALNYNGSTNITFADGTYTDGIYTVTLPHNSNLVLDPYTREVSIEPFANFSPQKILLCNCINGRACNGLLYDIYNRNRIDNIEIATSQKNKADNILNTLISKKKFFTIAHRGACGIFPENTIPAFEQAGIIGFDFIETDVQKTSDGVLVIMHDWNIDRTTDGTGGIASMTYDQLQLANIDYGANIERFTGLKIPTFDEYLKICGKYGAIPVVELKTTVADYLDIINAITNNGFKNKCFVLTQSMQIINDIRSMDAEQPLIFCTFYSLTESDLDTIAQLGGIMVAQNYENANETLLQYAHSLNLKYGVHTLDYGVYNYVSKGYDCVISDVQCFGADVDFIDSSIAHDLLLYDNTEISNFIEPGISYSSNFDSLSANQYGVTNGVLKIRNSSTRGMFNLPLDVSKYDIADVIFGEFKIKNHPYVEINGTTQYYAAAFLEISNPDGSDKISYALHATNEISDWEKCKIAYPIPWAIRKLIRDGADKIVRLRIGTTAGTVALWEIKDVTVSVKRVSKFTKF